MFAKTWRTAAFAFIMAVVAWTSHAVTVCTLKDPDRDVRRFFPQATNYKSNRIVVGQAGGDAAIRDIEARLGDKLDPKYEGKDVEHTTYTVLKGKAVVGYVSGSNQKGEFGNLQIFVATDPDGKVLEVYYQRIVSPHAKELNAKTFTTQFKGLTLADFYRNTPAVESLKAPSPKSAKDFAATVRGIRKNLIYFDLFALNRKHDPVFEKAVASQKGNK